jgi:membrane-associated HD superfamily phosphohydrolase
MNTKRTSEKSNAPRISVEKDPNENKKTKRISDFLEKINKYNSVDDDGFKDLMKLKEENSNISENFKNKIFFLILVSIFIFICQLLYFAYSGNYKNTAKMILDMILILFLIICLLLLCLKL